MDRQMTTEAVHRNEEGPAGRARWLGTMLAVGAVVMLNADAAQAYLGPGGAASALGTLLALLAAIVMAVFGFLWFPIKRLLRRRKASQTNPARSEGPSAASTTESESK